MPAPPQNPLILTAVGPSINLSCPDSFVGREVSGAAGDVSTSGGVGNFPFGSASLSLRSTLTDSLLPIGGNGAGTIEFTLTYTWQGLEDNGSGSTAADLFLNEMQAWSQSDPVCPTPPMAPCYGFPNHQSIIVVDEPITYGVPFSYRSDVSFSASGIEVGGFNQLSISTSLLTGGQLVELPEAGTLVLALIGSLAFY